MTCPCCMDGRLRALERRTGGGPAVEGELVYSDIPDFDGEGSEFGMDIDLPADVRRAVAAAPSLVVLEPGALSHVHCDQLTENDERSLMVLGCLDGREAHQWSGRAFQFGPGSRHGDQRHFIRRPAP